MLLNLLMKLHLIASQFPRASRVLAVSSERPDDFDKSQFYIKLKINMQQADRKGQRASGAVRFEYREVTRCVKDKDYRRIDVSKLAIVSCEWEIRESQYCIGRRRCVVMSITSSK